MIKVVSTVPRQRFTKYGIEFPTGWDVQYVDYPVEDQLLVKACRGADFLFVQSVHVVNKYVIENCPSLRFIHVEGVAFDKVDVDAAAQAGLPVCNNRAVNNKSVAEHAVGLIIAGLRRMALADREIKAGNFAECQSTLRSQGVKELSSQHIGIVGMGAIGQETAYLLSAFGCKISYYDAFRPSPEREAALKISYLPLEELIRQCDVISLHVPVLPETVNMIGARELAMMKKNALVINTSRGEVLDQKALAAALENGQISGAAIDTLSPEPPPDDHPLLNLSRAVAERILITPHIAGTTDEAFKRMLQWAIANMRGVAKGEDPVNVVNGLKKARIPG